MSDILKFMRENNAFIVIQPSSSYGFEAALVKSDSRSHTQSMVMHKNRNFTSGSTDPKVAADKLFDEIARRIEGDE